MPLFTNHPADQAFERFMKHQPNRYMDTPEADRIQSILDAEKERREPLAMIYRDNRHQRTFEKELTLHPKTANRKLLAALYLLTADGNLWTQARDQVTIRKICVDEMRSKNLSGTGYVFFSAAKDILTGSRNIQLKITARKGCAL